MKHTPSFAPPAKGFSLIITITMLVLLSLVAVGVLGLSTTTLRASSQSEAMALARSNARLGMSIALGEIQRTLGPDRRVTARSEILSPNPAAPFNHRILQYHQLWKRGRPGLLLPDHA